MSNFQSVMREFIGQERGVFIPKAFIKMTGDMESAALLAQIIYWSQRTDHDGGWFWKSLKDWDDELGLSPYQVRRCTKTLRAFGAETKLKKANGTPTVYYRLNWAVLERKFNEYLEKSDGDWIVKKLDNRETSQSINIDTSNIDLVTDSDSHRVPLSDKSDERESKPKKVVPQNLSLNALAWNISGLTPDQINGKGSYYGMMLNGSPPDKKNRMGLFDLLGMPHPKRGSPEDQALADEINSMYRWWPTAKPGMNIPTGEVTIARAIKDYRASRKPAQHTQIGFQPHETVLHTIQDGVTIPFTVRNGLPYDEHGNILPPELPPKYKPILPGDPDDDEPQF